MNSNSKKVGIIIDSGSSIQNHKLKNLEIVPLIVNEIIDDKTFSFKDGKDLSREDIYKKIQSNSKLSTSQAIPGDCFALVEKMFKKYDEILVFPLSKGLSGTYNTWLQVVKEFDNKNIFVFDHNDVGYGSFLAVKDSYEKYLKGETPEEIQKYLDKRNERREGVITINDLDILIRGGRLSSFKGKIAKFLNLKVLVSFKGSLNVISKTNSMESVVNNSLKHIDSNIKFSKKGIRNAAIVFNSLDPNDNLVKEYKDNIYKWLEKKNIKGIENIVLDHLPSVISVHTGINTLTIWIESNE